MTVVLIPSESPEGHSALASALREARLRDLPVTVVTTASGTDEPRAVEAEREVLLTRLREVMPDDVTWSLDLVSPGSDAPGALVEHLDRLDPALVVLGSRRRSAVGKMLLGRTVGRLLLEVSAEILVVKPRG